MEKGYAFIKWECLEITIRRSLAKGDEDGGHVVHAVLAGAVLADELVEELLEDTGALLFVMEPPADPFYHVFVGLDFPDAIAAHDYEIDAFILELLDVGVGGDHLLLGGYFQVAFVLEVAQRPRQVQVAVDAAVTDDSSSSGDTI